MASSPSSDLAYEQQPAGAWQDGNIVPAERLESTRDKFFRKMKEQPLVPIGSLLTCGALIAASNHLRKGNRNEFQKALRWRVGFQGLTILGAVAGSLYYNQKVSTPAPPPVPSSSPGSVAPGVEDAAGGAAARQTNLWQQMRADERAAKQKAGFNERLDKAKARADRDEEKELEEALLGKEEDVVVPPPTKERSRPVIGMDARRQV
ncbi:uncharacterized protein PFL1_00193 [Pseudozyma flocculosa PF-1]|uniref:Related to Respiratory supercomplex factor 1, mitochondrial n=1 Tax=Pseudozyma flocculosa TaxID=84751 RepID=A0A5C3ESR8_9BASI|nr:uncharacterized protein PFL1_00193 [Pseudozyma flocculosa PF-1]EPQ31995.1 hypothetical protein PFL1_00193 [Pseudozyma flocculosa PF-1]SPO35082.1 related to Respiratory supercomplex factor 1, mitochondrial [Pseudozyma flocculosa]